MKYLILAFFLISAALAAPLSDEVIEDKIIEEVVGIEEEIINPDEEFEAKVPVALPQTEEGVIEAKVDEAEDAEAAFMQMMPYWNQMMSQYGMFNPMMSQMGMGGGYPQMMGYGQNPMGYGQNPMSYGQMSSYGMMNMYNPMMGGGYPQMMDPMMGGMGGMYPQMMDPMGGMGGMGGMYPQMDPMMNMYNPMMGGMGGGYPQMMDPMMGGMGGMYPPMMDPMGGMGGMGMPGMNGMYPPMGGMGGMGGFDPMMMGGMGGMPGMYDHEGAGYHHEEKVDTGDELPFKNVDYPIDYTLECSDHCGCEQVCKFNYLQLCTCRCPPPCSVPGVKV